MAGTQRGWASARGFRSARCASSSEARECEQSADRKESGGGIVAPAERHGASNAVALRNHSAALATRAAHARVTLAGRVNAARGLVTRVDRAFVVVVAIEGRR